MNSKPSSSKSTNSTASNNITSKLRRLKIEENLLMQSLEKLTRKKNYSCNEKNEYDIGDDLDYKKFLKYLKDTFINIRNLYDEVKTVSSSQDLLAELEIDEIKKKVFELETGLKSFKTYINSELSTMKSTEVDIIKQMDELHTKEMNLNKKRLKIPSANLKEIVPSPVKLQMTSPYKCSDVQEFQDFMKNSSNRYGGWIEYHHSIFVKYWQKYFKNNNEDLKDTLVEKLLYENFVEEVLFKLQGIDKESLMAHIEWYKKYLFLKEKQQKAIDRWKSSRISISKITNSAFTKDAQQKRTENSKVYRQCKDVDFKMKENHSFTSDAFLQDFNEIARDFIAISNTSNILVKPEELKLRSKPKQKIIEKFSAKDSIERLTRPTKQWTYRNNSDDIHIGINNFTHIDNSQKLGRPNWRLPLALRE